MRRSTLTAITLLPLSAFSALVPGASAQAAEVDAEEPGARPAKVLPAPDPPQAAADRTWYGWQIMLADAAAFACVGLTEQEACLAGFALSGPVVHTTHGRLGRGIASLGMRVGLPIIGGLIGAAVANCPTQPPMSAPTTTQSSGDGHAITFDFSGLNLCGLSEIGTGVMAGAATAMVVDGFMAFSDRTPEPATESRHASRFAITPRLAVGQNNVAMGLSGTF